MNKTGKAVKCYKEAIQLNPNHQAAWSNMGIVFKSQGKMKKAVANYKRALVIEPENANTHNNLGNALFDQGEIEKAIKVFRHLLTLKPKFAEAHSNLLLLMHYSLNLDMETIFREHRAWVEANSVGCQKISTFKCDQYPEKRLKIGYVSPDFRNHSIVFFLEPLLTHHNSDHLESFCYSAVLSPDETTERLKSLVSHWTSIVGQSDESGCRSYT